ncbi:hypothetical protein AVEN_171740-1, partial [Araneus ventricosus]
CECGPGSSCTFSGLFSQKACICKPGYWDPGDRRKPRMCVACECGPDSSCTRSGLFQQKKCICKPGYRDVHGKCVGPCDNQPCQNGGTCKEVKTGFICNCFAPFSGPRCENGPCTSNPCQNHGTCKVSGDSYRCNCNKPFKGTNCEIGKFKLV